MTFKTLSKLRILVVDDHALLRRGLSDFLRSFGIGRSLDEAESGTAALEKTKWIKPDLVFLDISMPGMSGIEVTSEIKRISPQTKVAIFTMYDDWEHAKAAFNAGADGYILKSADPKELKDTIHQVMDGIRYVSKDVVPQNVKASSDPGVIPNHNLTKREVEITDLLCQGYSAKQIAGKLFLSEATVNNHRAHIMRKLGVGNTAGIVRKSLYMQIISNTQD